MSCMIADAADALISITLNWLYINIERVVVLFPPDVVNQIKENSPNDQIININIATKQESLTSGKVTWMSF